MNKEIQRGHHAKRLLEDPLLSEAFEAADETFVDEWRNGEDINAREAAWAKQGALEEVRRFLRACISDAEYEEARRSADDTR